MRETIALAAMVLGIGFALEAAAEQSRDSKAVQRACMADQKILRRVWNRNGGPAHLHGQERSQPSQDMRASSHRRRRSESGGGRSAQNLLQGHLSDSIGVRLAQTMFSTMLLARAVLTSSDRGGIVRPPSVPAQSRQRQFVGHFVKCELPSIKLG
jgi:hypothetical protein